MREKDKQGSRFREIMDVLRKHDLLHGIDPQKLRVILEELDPPLSRWARSDEIAAKLAENYVKQVLDDGFFHGDPHPGNIFIRDGKIIWLDLSMMGRFTSRDKALITDAVKAIQAGDVYQLKSVVLSMAVLRQKIDHAALYTDIDLMINKYAAMDLASLNLGNVFLELNDIMVKHRIGLPSGVSVFARGIASMEGVLTDLCPDICLMDILAAHMVGLKVDWEKEFRDVGSSILSSLKRGVDAPGHVADILKMLLGAWLLHGIIKKK